MRLNEDARGVYPIAVTPFGDRGELDLAGTPRLVDFYAAREVHGLTILGMMGEAPKLSAGESLAFAKAAIRSAGPLPVVVGISSPGLATMRELAQSVMDAGAAGVMVAPTPDLRTDAAVLRYFEDVADSLGDIPFVLQDFPQSTGVHVSAPVMSRIVADVPTCVMLKHEDWPGLEKITAVRAAGPRRISILAGNGGLFLPEELRRGADGAMTGFAYPEMMVGVCAAHEAGDPSRAADLFDIYLPLARYELQPGVGLAVRKFVLQRRGAIASAALRRPGASLSPQAIAEVTTLLERQDRRLAAFG